MDDGRRELVEVAQPKGHLEKNGRAGIGRKGSVCVQTAAEGGGHVLHHQLGQLGARFHMHAQELDYVWVVESPKQLTLCSKSDVGGWGMGCIEQPWIHGVTTMT